jgi:hypothetical protein
MTKEILKSNDYSTPIMLVNEMYMEGILCASSKESTTEEWDIVDLSNL